MEWHNEPQSVMMGGSTIIVTTEPKTDVWRQPIEGGIRDTAHFHFGRIIGDFTAEVIVDGDFTEQYDQAGLMIRRDGGLWLKCGIEFVDGRRYASVVVTREWSDWSLADMPEGAPLTIRVDKHGDIVKIWRIVDGEPELLRKTFFPDSPELEVGIAAASPGDRGFDARFEGFIVRRGGVNT